MTWKNKLYFGDNLAILREHVQDETVDLVYLDPPFNSAANYNVLFQETSGAQSAAQITAFEDTWHWTQDAENAFHDLVTTAPERVVTIMQALRSFLGTSDMMAYITMLAPRLLELHRVLKPTGSLYLHCDPTASHYIKILLDAIFSPLQYRNEIVWKRTSGHNDARRRFGDQSDTILFYAKDSDHTFNTTFAPYTQKYIQSHYSNVDEKGRRFTTRDLRSPSPRLNLTYDYKGYKPHANGWSVSLAKMKELDAAGLLYFPEAKDGRIRLKRYLDEMPGMPIGNVWEDIPPINSQAQERLGYPTQKPEALLERIIKASSNEGDIVLDPFCGCGTSISVAERLHRHWIGIDITHIAISLIKSRLHDTFKSELATYEVTGDPKDLTSAEALALQDRYQFQWWAVGLVEGRPAQDKKKGKDTGIDGYIYFFDDNSGQAKKIILQVKSGNVKSGDIRDLKGVLEREKAQIGAFITLKPSTKDMRTEAVSAGYYEPQISTSSKYPKLQILTIEELLNGAKLLYPQWAGAATFKRAERQSKDRADQSKMF
jgi:site-specific DNA-methyltransferase (adenine-specific)